MNKTQNIGVAAALAIVAYRLAAFAPRRALGVILAIGAFALMFALSAMAGTDATVIIDSAGTAFVAVATLCVSIGTFFAVYKLVKKIK